MRFDSDAPWATAGRSLLAFIVLGAVTVSCGDSNSPPAFGPPASMVKIAGDEGSGNAGTVLAPAPAVLISDAEGRPVPGVEVTFAVMTGNGAVTGATAETDEDGIATVGGWTMGSLGENTMRASAASLTAVTFSATSLCAPLGPLSLGGTVSGTLAVTDCRYPEGYFTDRYTFTLAAPTVVRFTQTSANLDSYIEVFAADEIVAFHDDIDPPSNLDSDTRVALPAGTYHVGATTGPVNQIGTYVLGAQSASSALTGCDFIFALPGIAVDQELESSDCPTEPPSEVFYTETFLIFLRAGTTRTVTLTSSAFATHLTVARLQASGSLADVRVDDSSDGNNSQLVYSVTTSGLYLIFASSGPPATGGTYRLSIQ